jgi:acyl-CoA-dependent ceramide synthase
MITWVIARHILYLMVCYSVWHDIPIYIDYGCYQGKKGSLEGPFPVPNGLAHWIQPIVNPDGIVCFNHAIKWCFLTGLLFLQAITLMWFWMICKVAVKVVRGGQADDTRSDDESEVSEEVETATFKTSEAIEVQWKEEEVGVEAINLRARKNATKRYQKSISTSSGVTLSADRKEILGRIGCDKSI